MGLFRFRKVNTSTRRKEAKLVIQDRNNLLYKTSDFFMLEAYKTLRTNVTFSLTNDVDGGYVVAVTSALQGEGKSFNAVNLAISYAQADKKVLLIDCDLRRPKISRLLDLKSDFGLSNILVSPSLVENSLKNTPVDNLDVIISGDIPPNPSELLGSSKMEEILKWARENYDLIILDTPPINVVTDTVVLSSMIDGILFVVRAGRTERQDIIQAIDKLEYAQARILGFILNDIDQGKGAKGYKKYRYKKYNKYSHYAYGYTYGYGYGYGYKPKESKDSDNKK